MFTYFVKRDSRTAVVEFCDSWGGNKRLAEFFKANNVLWQQWMCATLGSSKPLNFPNWKNHIWYYDDVWTEMLWNMDHHGLRVCGCKQLYKFSNPMWERFPNQTMFFKWVETSRDPGARQPGLPAVWYSSCRLVLLGCLGMDVWYWVYTSILRLIIL